MLSVALPGLQAAVNRYLSLAHNRDELLAPLVGRVVALELRGLGLTLHFFFGREQIEILKEFPGTPDVTLKGTPLSFLAMKYSKGHSRGLLIGDLNIEGNTHIAQRFNALLEDLDIDWEEHLSKLTGDAIAHRIGGFVKDFQNWRKKTKQTITTNLSEYIHHELRLVPSRFELEDFYDDVDTLRSDLDRLTQKIALLQARNAS